MWVEEKHKAHFINKYEINKVLFSEKGPFQKVEVVETLGHGRMLLNDDLVMATEKDEFIYHDMIAHVPLFVHPNPKKVLVIGGGDGGTAREVLRHPGVERVVMVEIDQLVVDACKEFLPLTAASFNHPKLELLIEDGVKYMEESQELFDVILIDSTDPIGPATPLFGEEFYRNVFKRLGPQGIVVSQGESPFYEKEMQRKLMEILNTIFPCAHIYNFTNMTYPGGLWSFTYASKGLHPLSDFNESRVRDSGLKFKYYNAALHRGSFALPSFMLENIGDLIKSGQ